MNNISKIILGLVFVFLLTGYVLNSNSKKITCNMGERSLSEDEEVTIISKVEVDYNEDIVTKVTVIDKYKTSDKKVLTFLNHRFENEGRVSSIFFDSNRYDYSIKKRGTSISKIIEYKELDNDNHLEENPFFIDLINDDGNINLDSLIKGYEKIGYLCN